MNTPYLLAGAAIACTVVGAASANVTIADYHGPNDFEFQVSYMPDLDQKRATLPGDGCMFCIPTCMMNLFSYAAEWGFEDLAPGPGVYQGDVSYSTMTNKLKTLGSLMGTGLDDFVCEDGTDGNGWLAGTSMWLTEFPFIYKRLGVNEDTNWCPQLLNAAWWTANGAIVSFVYGWYIFNPGAEPILGARTGGHCVTIAYMRSDPPFGDLTLHVRNPSNSSSIYTQAPWAYGIWDVETMSVRQDWDNDSAYVSTDVTVINYNPNAATIKLLDAVYVLVPETGYSWSTVVLNVGPLPSGGWTLPPPQQGFVPDPGFAFTDVARNMFAPTFFVLASEGPLTRLLEADPLTGAMETLAEIPGATDIAVGRHRDLYVLAGAQLYQLGLDGQVKQVVPLPYPCEAIAYRDAVDWISLLSSSTQHGLVYDPAQGNFVFDGPIAIPTTLDPSMAVRESDGATAVLVPETPDLIFGVMGSPPVVEVAVFPGLDAKSVAFDDREHLVVATAGGSVKEFEPSGPGPWDWTEVSPSWYDEVQAVGAFRVERSRTNYDPATDADEDIQTPADELEYYGTEIYDCPGDFDNDQVIGILDFLDLLAHWGPCAGCPEDIDGDGEVSILDFLMLLSAWGDCEV